MVIFFILILVAHNYFSTIDLKNNVGDIYTEGLVPTESLGRIHSAIYKYRSDIYKYILLPDARAAIRQDIDQDVLEVEQNLREYRENGEEEDESNEANAFAQQWANYQQKAAEIIRWVEAGQENAAIAIIGSQEMKDIRNELDQKILILIDLEKEQGREAVDTTYELIRVGMIQKLTIALFGLTSSFFVASMISKSITKPLQQTVQMLQEMSLGRLSHRLPFQRKDEIGVLAMTMNDFSDYLQNTVIASMNKISEGDLAIHLTRRDDLDEINPALQKTVQSLQNIQAETRKLASAASKGQMTVRGDESIFQGGYREIIRGFNDTLDILIQPILLILETTHSLNAASTEILAAATQQAAGASQQSAAISQTTTTIEEVKSISEQAVLHAQEVTEVTQQTIEIVRLGRAAVQETINQMNLIRERVAKISEHYQVLSVQAQQIVEIISTVNGIASQSNMLALNASVEAVRAGEAGKGFAVVAAEVRGLAAQSHQATNQVKGILTDIQKATGSAMTASEEGLKEVDSGIKTVEKANAAIEQIAAVVNQVSKIAAQVSAGGQQQRAGVNQIALAMQHINQATTQGFASTRQTEQSAQNLNGMARHMADAIRQFQV